MNKIIKIKDRTVDCQIVKNKRARNIVLRVVNDKKIKVTLPAFFYFKSLDKILKQKESWIYSKLKDFNENKGCFYKTRSDYINNKEKAREILINKVDFYSRKYSFDYARVFIKDQKTRWGSCSLKGNLNFNYKLIFLPEKLLDYVVVHEICHLKEMNHSRDFWNLVSLTFPDYKDLKRELRKINFFHYK